MSDGPVGHNQGEPPPWAFPEQATAPPEPMSAPGGWGAPPPRPYAGAPAPRWSPPAPNLGVVPLRPLGVMEILDGAIGTVRSNPRTTMGLAAVVASVTTIVQIAATVLLLGDQLESLTDATAATPVSRSQIEALVSDGGTTLAITTVVGFVAGVVLTGMITAVVGRAVLGHRVDLRTAWGQARPRLLALFGVSLAVLLATLLLIGIAGGAAAAVGFATGSVVAGVVTAMVLVPVAIGCVLWIAVVTALAGPAVVLERQPVSAALRRSRLLVRGSFWRVLGVIALVNILATLIAGVLSLPFSIVASIVNLTLGHGAGSLSLLPELISGVGSVLSGTITMPFVSAATALLYVDQRMRREGLDLELTRVVAAEGAQPGLAAP